MIRYIDRFYGIIGCAAIDTVVAVSIAADQKKRKRETYNEADFNWRGHNTKSIIKAQPTCYNVRII